MTEQLKKSKRGQVLGILKQATARLGENERHRLAADLDILLVFNVVFVKGVDGRPEGEDRAP